MLTFQYPDDQNQQVDHIILCGDLHGSLWKEQGEIITSRRTFWGVEGVSEIVSPGVGTEKISTTAWIHDAQFTPDQDGATLLDQYLAFLDGLRGKHGTVIQSGATIKIQRTFYNCTFEGYTPEVLEGQVQPDFVPRICCPQWVQAVTLTWTTLKFQQLPAPTP